MTEIFVCKSHLFIETFHCFFMVNWVMGLRADLANHTVICLRVQGTHGFLLSIGYTDFTVITL